MSNLLQADYLVSCVVPVCNEEHVIERFIEALAQTMQATGYRFELVIIDDGSRDQTPKIIHAYKEHYPIRYLRFSRNFGKENALSAGLDYAHGDAIIILDSDFQHPLELIPDFLMKWREGYDMVYGVRHDRQDEPRLKRVCASAFYRFTSKVNRISIPANAGDFRLLNKKAVRALQALPERNRFMKGLYSWVGFKQFAIPFTVQPRAGGKSQWNFYSLLDLAITGITSFTAFPLRIIALGGIGTATIAFLYASWIIISTMLFGIETPGWATIVTIFSFFSGLQLFALGIVGEYIGRIFDEVKQRPHYIIDEDVSFDSVTS